MKIAYLILAHHQPGQLARLVAGLSQPHAFFFIHVDHKSPHKAAIRERLSAFVNVQIIATRDVNWMGFTTIDAELDLLKLAFSSGSPFKYYVLMSGQDYPIKSNSYINDFFTKHTEDFIQYNSISYMSEKFVQKHAHYHFRDIPFVNPRSPRKIPALVYLYFGLHNRLVKVLPKRRFYKNMELFFGSQWFALTHDTVSFVLSYVAEHEGFVRSMKHTDGPDETFFQTIILNSERKTNVYDYDRYREWLKTRKDGELYVARMSSLRYMDWSEHAKSKPAVLDEAYIQELADSYDLFARKFDEVASAGLLDYLDANVLKARE